MVQGLEFVNCIVNALMNSWKLSIFQTIIVVSQKLMGLKSGSLTCKSSYI